MSKTLSVILYLSLYSSIAFIIGKRKQNLVFIGVSFIVLAVFSGIRYKVGTDFEAYIYIYKYISKISFFEWLNSYSLDSMGLVVFLIAKISSILGGVNYFFGIFSFLIAFLTIQTIRKEYSEIIQRMAIFIFLITGFTEGFNGIRQYLAISICFWGLKYVYQKKFFNFILVILIAFSTHVTAICFFPVYFLWNKKKRNLVFDVKTKLFLIIISFAVFFYKKILIILGGRFASYIKYSNETRNLSFYIILIWFFIFIIFWKKLSRVDKRNKLLIVMCFIGVLCKYLGFYSPAVSRVASYFNYTHFILLGQIPKLFTKKKYLVMIILLSYVIVKFVGIAAIDGQGDIIPYNYKIITTNILNSNFK